MMESIAAASMSMSQMQFANAYDMAILKKSMESMESQAETLINDMLAAVPAPSQYGFDVYG
ncbi:MAG: YjfB family protein [Oscillospiraceae bacterium]|nr:YjfB family protein [Oscillospiraceae bacterium]